jgi:cytochrome d ubiquinol oxidase subunit II
MLIGIVLRGSAFVFRAYGPHGRNRWGLAFASASVITPVLLGSIIGSVATGAVADAAARIGGAVDFFDVFVRPWAAPFPTAIGLLALALFSFLAATYLTVDAREEDCERTFASAPSAPRRRVRVRRGGARPCAFGRTARGDWRG